MSSPAATPTLATHTAHSTAQAVGHAVQDLVAPMQHEVQRHSGLVLAEAAQISSGTLDYAAILGGVWGLLFGAVLPAQLSGNLDLANLLVQSSLLGHLASVSVLFIVSLRIILARGMRDQSWVAVDDGHHVMLRHIAASAWAAMLALFAFLLAAVLGYSLGLLAGLPGLVGDMLGMLADGYSVGALAHLTLRVLVEAAAVAWIAFFDMIILSTQREDMSRSITRKLLLLVCAVIGLEALDAYLTWNMF